MLTLRIFFRELLVLFAFAAGVTAIVRLLPPERALPWSVLLLGLYFGVRTLLRIEAALSEEYRETLANRQAIGFLYGLFLLLGVGLGVGGAWWASRSTPRLGMSAADQEERLDARFIELRVALDAIRSGMGTLVERETTLGAAVDALPGRMPRPIPYGGPSAQGVESRLDAIRGLLQNTNDRLSAIEQAVREDSDEGRH